MIRKHLKYKDYLNATKQVLEESQKIKKPYRVDVLDKKYIVLPNVFSPKYFHDTELFAKNLPISKNDELLEIGPGTGIVSIISLYRGARSVVAIDINPGAVKNTKLNAVKHNFQDKIDVRAGNVYSAIKAGEKFDKIFWNSPFGFIKEKNISDLEKSVFDPGYISTKKFVLNAKKYLKKDGKVYIGFSSTLGKLDLIKQFAKEANFKLKCIFSEDSTEIYPVKFEIYKLTQKL